MIVMGSDHGAYELKSVLKQHLEAQGKEVNDLGVYDATSVDYPDIAEKVCAEVKTGKYEFGILLCGCALVLNEYSAEKAKQHNNANVIAMGGRVLGPDLAKSILDAFMRAEFEGGRHQQRLDKLHALEK